ncbi:hypothetical protein GCM10027592_33860 [Spirosoma flavus]
MKRLERLIPRKKKYTNYGGQGSCQQKKSPQQPVEQGNTAEKVPKHAKARTSQNGAGKDV